MLAQSIAHPEIIGNMNAFTVLMQAGNQSSGPEAGTGAMSMEDC